MHETLCWLWCCCSTSGGVGSIVATITLLPLRKCFVVPAVLPVLAEDSDVPVPPLEPSASAQQEETNTP